MTTIDKKYKFLAVNPSKGTFFTEDEGFIFKATDKFAVRVLEAYITMLERDNEVGDAQLDSACALKKRVQKFQEDNPDKVMTPDVDMGLEAETVLSPDSTETHLSEDVIYKMKQSLKKIHLIADEHNPENSTDWLSVRNEATESLDAMGENIKGSV